MRRSSGIVGTSTSTCCAPKRSAAQISTKLLPVPHAMITWAGLKHLPPTVLRVEERWDLDAQAPVERAVDELATHTPCLRIGQI